MSARPGAEVRARRSEPAIGELPALVRLRRRLTAWYVATFAVMLLALGLLLFAVIARQQARELTDSLRAATREIERAAAIREREAVTTGGSAVDAVQELRIPDRALYLFDSAGRVLTPPAAAPSLRAAALAAAAHGSVDEQLRAPRDRALVLHGESFVTPSGRRYVALAVADRVELEDRYASLIVTFAGLAVIAIVLVAAGGWILARAATAPVARSIAHMRRFMADAAHELRTPVAVLRSGAEVALQRDRTPEAYVAALGRVGREAEQLGKIVDDLLTLARADAGERPVARARVALDDVVLDAVTAAGALAEPRGVRLEVGAADEVAIDADPALVRQLVMILLDNAIKFTPARGTVTVDVEGRDGRALLRVRDTGAGIAASDLPRVFDRFFRGEGARGHAGGAGLGLSIARWIAEAHGARLELASAPGEGTTAVASFPRVP